MEKYLGRQKVLMLYGSRRTGKTTIIKNISKNRNSLLLNGEDMDVSDVLQKRTLQNYRQLIGDKSLLIIDEAQAIPNLGSILKFMIDSIENLTIIVTGSSSFDLVNETGEPLVGRNIVFQLHPFAQVELSKHENAVETRQLLGERLIFGGYPEVIQITDTEEKCEYLRQLINSYLLKDILTLTTVKGADVLYKLLKLLAYQVGSQVSTTELGTALKLNSETVERYLDLLSKVFIIFPLSGYSKNLRKEVTKSKKWYFYDNGVRNALINNFLMPEMRGDMGQLWEQYFISERMKYNVCMQNSVEYFFWRTYDGQEIDLLELDSSKHLHALEMKWGSRKHKKPGAFAKAYPDATWTVILKENYFEHIT